MGRQTRPAESRGGGASPFPAPGAAGEWAGWARLRPGGLLYGGTVGPASAHAHHSVQLIATLGEDGSVSGRVPDGNTGRTNAGLSTPMPIPQDLRLLLGRTDLPVEPALAQGPVEGGARQ